MRSILWPQSFTHRFSCLKVRPAGPLYSRKRRISCGWGLFRVVLLVWKKQRLLGQTGRQGEGSWLPHSLPALLSFAFSCDRGREAHRLMLFAWPSIMHEMIHNLLSLVYHLQRINNGILASCFFSICHCCLSNSVCEEWLVQFCTCVMSSQKSIFEQCMFSFYPSSFIRTLYCCWSFASGHLLSQWDGVWLLKLQWEWPVTGEKHQYSFLKRWSLLWLLSSISLSFSMSNLLWLSFPPAYSFVLYISPPCSCSSSRAFYTVHRLDKCLHSLHYVHDTAPVLNYRPVDFCWCKEYPECSPLFHRRTTA